MGLCTSYFLKSLHYTIFEGKYTIFDEPVLYLKATAQEDVLKFSTLFPTKSHMTLNGTDVGDVYGTEMVAFGFVLMMLRFYNDLLWVMGFALMTLWAVVFWSIFRHTLKLAADEGQVSVTQVR